MERSVYLLINSYFLNLSAYKNSSKIYDEQKEQHEQLLKSMQETEGYYSPKAAQEIYTSHKALTQETRAKLNALQSDYENSRQQLIEVLTALDGGKILWRWMEADPFTEVWLEKGEIKFLKRESASL